MLQYLTCGALNVAGPSKCDIALMLSPRLAVLTVDYLDVTHPERATLPRFEEIQGEYSKELGSYVQFPHFNLRTQGLRGSEDAKPTPTTLNPH